MSQSKYADIIGAQNGPLAFEATGTKAASLDAGPMAEHSCRMLVWSLEGFQKDAVLTSANTGKSWRLPSDEGKHMTGFDAAPAPLTYISAGLAKAYVDEINALAVRRGIEIGPIGMKVDNPYEIEGAIARKTMKGIPLPFTVTAALPVANAGEEVLAELLRDAVLVAPVAGLFSQLTRGLFWIRLNGKPLKVDTLPHCEPLVDDLASYASSALPEGDTRKSLLHRDGDAMASTLGKQVHVSGSLSDARPDALAYSRMELCAPRSSAWKLCVDGDAGRAPDPLSLVSSGMGFCFMTKLHMLAARYNIPIASSCLLQHTRFGPGGATGGTGKAPDFSPPTTQLDLESSASPEQIAELVTLTESACYVHMACQTVLKPRLRIVESVV